MIHAIFGYGVVGKALYEVLVETGDHVARFDPAKPDLGSLYEAERAGVWWVCVPTDGQANGKLDLTFVRVIIENAQQLPHRPLVIVKSTLGISASHEFTYDRWAFSPEFLVESAPSMRNPSRLVIGANTLHVLDEATRICAAVPSWKHALLVQGTIDEAVLIKLASNAMLATKVEIANELFDLCQQIGASYDTVRLGVSLDKRIGGAHLLVPGPDGLRGFGGKCLPKDTAELAALCPVFDTVSRQNKQRRNVYQQSQAAE